MLVIGVGGLGSPLLLYLASAGVGHIGVVDEDVVDVSNLQRQVLYATHDVGRAKAEVAAERIRALNPHVSVETYPVRLNSDNAMSIIGSYDVVADGTDNFPTRYLTNDACVLLGKQLAYASIFRFDGQASIFNVPRADGSRGPNYRDLFPSPPPPSSVPSCAEGGVLGVLPGMMGCIQANEVIKVITGIGRPLSGRLLLFDALRFETRMIEFACDPKNPLSGDHPTITELIDYEGFCGLRGQTTRGIAAEELQIMIQEGRPFQLIDVRTKEEYDLANLGGILIPLAALQEHLSKIRRDCPVVVHCKTGIRSAQAVSLLQQQGFRNVSNLEGGIVAFAKSFRPDLIVY